VVGLANTSIHWLTFFILHMAAGFNQALSNFFAFCVAASFSFYVNALYTFMARISLWRYLLFVGFMGALSLGTGYAADRLKLPALLTLLVFSAASLVCGFLYSKLVVFRETQG